LVAVHLAQSTDDVTIYYTDYFGYPVYNVALPDLPLVIGKNFSRLLWGVARRGRRNQRG
jgi:hypothetical protein